MRLIYIVLLTLLGTSLLGIPQAEAIHTRQVDSSEDDADERGNGTFSTTRNSADIYSNTNTGIANYRSAGFRFENIPIDQGEQIENAYIELYILNNDDMNAIIYAHDADNSVDFSINANIIDNAQRPKTDNYFTWVENSLGPNSWENSDNFANILQEIVDRPGWEAGNAITILLIARNDQTLNATTRTYDFNTSLAAKLHFHYQPTIENTHYPLIALPQSTINITQSLVSHGQEAYNITARIMFSVPDFRFQNDYPENDNTIENCLSEGTVDAEWFVATPAIEDNYTFSVVWEFVHEDYHVETSDTFTIEVVYFEDTLAVHAEGIIPEHGNPGIPTTGSGEGVGILAAGIALIAVALSVAAMRGN